MWINVAVRRLNAKILALNRLDRTDRARAASPINQQRRQGMGRIRIDQMLHGPHIEEVIVAFAANTAGEPDESCRWHAVTFRRLR